jgi:2-polyprenyl-3-methyl-5-hydroxy-6-metoxy-1,4-benzoquinol methylase
MKKLLFPRWTDIFIIMQNIDSRVWWKLYKALVSLVAPLRASAMHWNTTTVYDNVEVRFFWDIPLIGKYRIQQVTGDPKISRPTYVHLNYLNFENKNQLRALSVGSGSSRVEIEYAKLGKFEKIVCTDISYESLAAAAHNAKVAGVLHLFEFQIASVMDLLKDVQKYDVIFLFNCLHHIPDVGNILQKLTLKLNDHGILIIDDSIGPRHHRYPVSKLKLMQSLLELIPEEYRVNIKTGRIKKRVLIPSPLMIYLLDPSEMIASDEILPSIRNNYEILEFTPYAGSVLTWVLLDIAQNFLTSDGEAILRGLLEAEGALMKAGLDDPDNAFIIARKKTSTL